MNDFGESRAPSGQDHLLALLNLHQDTIYNLCYQVLRHPQNAQDAAQKVLLDLLGTLPRFSDEKHLRHWLHRASFHVALNMKKTSDRRLDREKQAAKHELSTPPSLADEIADALHEQVARLEGDLRALVVEHYFDQKPLAVLARKRGCSKV